VSGILIIIIANRTSLSIIGCILCSVSVEFVREDTTRLLVWLLVITVDLSITRKHFDIKTEANGLD
jgi:hypothetical protein